MSVQPKSPSTEDWIKKMWYIYTMEYYSAIKKNEIPFGPRECDTEWSQTEGKSIIWHPLYVDSIKKWYQWTYLQNRKRLTNLENEIKVEGKEGRKGERDS